MTSVNITTAKNKVTVSQSDASVVTVATVGPQGPQGIGSATVSIGTTATGSPGTDVSVTNTGSDTAAVLNFTIPQGATGAQGDVGPVPATDDGIYPDNIGPTIGPSATVAVGTTTTGAAGSNASVTNTGSTTAAVLNFTIPAGAAGAQGPAGADGNDGATGATGPQGPAGPAGATGATGADGIDGTAATISVGTVTTGAAGSSATVTNSGTAAAAVFDFSIPQGATGATGPAGANGADGADGANGGTDIVLDTTPQLGGDLDMNSKFISSGVLGVKNQGAQSELQLFCESSNAHYAAIKAPAHADFSGNITFTMPANYGSANQVLTTDGSGGTSWADASGGLSRAQTTAIALIFS